MSTQQPDTSFTEEVYMSISFTKISPSKAGHVLRAAMSAAGNENMCVHYDKALSDDDEEAEIYRNGGEETAVSS